MCQLSFWMKLVSPRTRLTCLSRFENLPQSLQFIFLCRFCVKFFIPWMNRFRSIWTPFSCISVYCSAIFGSKLLEIAPLNSLVEIGITVLQRTAGWNRIQRFFFWLGFVYKCYCRMLHSICIMKQPHCKVVSLPLTTTWYGYSKVIWEFQWWNIIHSKPSKRCYCWF